MYSYPVDTWYREGKRKKRIEQSMASPRAGSGLEAEALYNFSAEYASQLSLVEGQRVRVLEESDDGWWYGEAIASGRCGLFPVSFCRLVVAAADTTTDGGGSEAAAPAKSAVDLDADTLPGSAADSEVQPVKGAPSEWEALVQLLATVHLEQYASELRERLGVERVHDLANYVEPMHLAPPHLAMKPVHRSKMLRLIGSARAGRVGVATLAPAVVTAATASSARSLPRPVAAALASDDSWQSILAAQRSEAAAVMVTTAPTVATTAPLTAAASSFASSERVGLPRSAAAAAAVAALGGSAATAALPLGAFVIARNPRFSDMAVATRYSPRYWLARVVAVGGAGRCRLQWFVETALGSARYVFFHDQL